MLEIQFEYVPKIYISYLLRNMKYIRWKDAFE